MSWTSVLGLLFILVFAYVFILYRSKKVYDQHGEGILEELDEGK